MPQKATVSTLANVIIGRCNDDEPTQRNAVPKQIDEDSQKWHEKEPCILYRSRVPSGLDGVDVKSLLRHFGRVLLEDDGRARLEQRECDNAPERPG